MMMNTSNLISVAMILAVTIGFTFWGYTASPVSGFHLRKRDRRKGIRSGMHDRRDQSNILWGDVAFWIHKLTWVMVAAVLLMDFAITFAPTIR
jgi:hypothetical protein